MARVQSGVATVTVTAGLEDKSADLAGRLEDQSGGLDVNSGRLTGLELKLSVDLSGGLEEDGQSGEIKVWIGVQSVLVVTSGTEAQ